jgi:hypothetical protein
MIYRKFFSPSFVIAEGHTLHSFFGFVRHAMDGTPPALAQNGIFVPDVPVPSIMMEMALGYVFVEPFWRFPIVNNVEELSSPNK